MLSQVQFARRSATLLSLVVVLLLPSSYSRAQLGDILVHKAAASWEIPVLMVALAASNAPVPQTVQAVYEKTRTVSLYLYSVCQRSDSYTVSVDTKAVAISDLTVPVSSISSEENETHLQAKLPPASFFPITSAHSVMLLAGFHPELCSGTELERPKELQPVYIDLRDSQTVQLRQSQMPSTEEDLAEAEVSGQVRLHIMITTNDDGFLVFTVMEIDSKGQVTARQVRTFMHIHDESTIHFLEAAEQFLNITLILTSQMQAFLLDHSGNLHPYSINFEESETALQPYDQPPRARTYIFYAGGKLYISTPKGKIQTIPGITKAMYNGENKSDSPVPPPPSSPEGAKSTTEKQTDLRPLVDRRHHHRYYRQLKGKSKNDLRRKIVSKRVTSTIRDYWWETVAKRESRGNFRGAREFMHQILEIEPENFKVKHALVWNYVHRGMIDNARRRIQTWYKDKLISKRRKDQLLEMTKGDYRKHIEDSKPKNFEPFDSRRR